MKYKNNKKQKRKQKCRLFICDAHTTQSHISVVYVLRAVYKLFMSIVIKAHSKRKKIIIILVIFDYS